MRIDNDGEYNLMRQIFDEKKLSGKDIWVSVLISLDWKYRRIIFKIGANTTVEKKFWWLGDDISASPTVPGRGEGKINWWCASMFPLQNYIS